MSARVVAAGLVALATLVACGNQSDGDTAVPATEPPSTEPTIVGVITEVVPFEPVTEDCVEPDPDADPDSPVDSDESPLCTDPETAPLGTVLVEEDPTAESGDSKISFTIDRDTTLLTEGTGSADPLSYADLADGMSVSAWADGPIMESYPAQASAAAIVVRPG
ncbi:MAG TPA: hypothetical protein VIQ02_17115 [Jiangellaceae bacterium]